jgi:hypothetical protein
MGDDCIQRTCKTTRARAARTIPHTPSASPGRRALAREAAEGTGRQAGNNPFKIRIDFQAGKDAHLRRNGHRQAPQRSRRETRRACGDAVPDGVASAQGDIPNLQLYAGDFR